MSSEERKLKRIKRELLTIADYAIRQHKKFYREFFIGHGPNIRVGEQEKTAIVISEKERIKFHMQEYEHALYLYLAIENKKPTQSSEVRVTTNFPVD